MSAAKIPLVQTKSPEKVALSYYHSCFCKKAKKGLELTPYTSAIQEFMQDYFELDNMDLDQTKIMIKKHGKITWENYGKNLLGDEKFKEYCRRNVNFWRDQRNLI